MQTATTNAHLHLLLLSLLVATPAFGQNLTLPPQPPAEPWWAPVGAADPPGQIAFWTEPASPEYNSPNRGDSTRLEVVTNIGPENYTYHFSESYESLLVGQEVEVEVYQPEKIVFWPTSAEAHTNGGCTGDMAMYDPLVSGITRLLKLENNPGWHQYTIPVSDTTAAGGEGWVLFWYLSCDPATMEDEGWFMAEVTGLGRLFWPDAFPTASEPTGEVPQPSAALQLRAYPNPLRGGATLTATVEVVESGDYVTELYNLLAQSVWREEWLLPSGRHSFAIDTHGLAAGVYVLRLIGSGGIVTTKVTILR